MNQDFFSMVTSWSESPIDDDESKRLKWIGVVEIDRLGLYLGISCNKCWVRIGKQSVYEFCVDKSYMPLFPIFEESLLEIKIAIKAGLESKQLPVELVENFPFREVTFAGIKSKSEYWCRLALSYAEQIKRDEMLVMALEECSQFAPTQNLRHQAKKLKAKISRTLL